LPQAAEPELNLPTAQDLTASGVALPAMQMSLHVYDPSPRNRYVLMNSVKLREGDSTPDGMLLHAITASGVVLEWRGQRFLLRAGGQ
jgi:general secretion pathway protein B